MAAPHQPQEPQSSSCSNQEVPALSECQIGINDEQIEALSSLLYSEQNEDVLIHLLKAVQSRFSELTTRDQQMTFIAGVTRCLHHEDSFIREYAARTVATIAETKGAPLFLYLRKEFDKDPLVAEDVEKLYIDTDRHLKSLYENTGRRMKHFSPYAKKTDAKFLAEAESLTSEQIDEMSLMMLADSDASVQRDMAYLLSRHVKGMPEDDRDRLILYSLYGLQLPDAGPDVKKAMMYILDAAGASALPAMPAIRALYHADDRTLAAGAAATSLRILPKDREASAVLFSSVHSQVFFTFGPFPEPTEGPDLSTVDQFFEPYYQIIYTLTGDPAGLTTDTSELDVLKEKVKDAFSIIQDAYEKALEDLPAQFEGTARLLNEARREQVITRLAWLLPEMHDDYYNSARDFVCRALLDPNEPDSLRRSIIQFVGVRPEDSDRLVEVFLQSAIHTHQSAAVRSLACSFIVFIPDVSRGVVSKAKTILHWLAAEDADPTVREAAEKSLDRMSIFSCWRADDEPLSSASSSPHRAEDAQKRLQEIEGLVESLKRDLTSFVESLSESDDSDPSTDS